MYTDDMDTMIAKLRVRAQVGEATATRLALQAPHREEPRGLGGWVRGISERWHPLKADDSPKS